MTDPLSQGVKPTSLSISSLLNNPNAAILSSSRPSTKEIPLVHLSPVPSASFKDFSNYIALFGQEHDNYVRAKQYGLQQHLRSNHAIRKPSGSIFSGTDHWEARVAHQITSSTTHSTRLSLDETTSVVSSSPTSELNGFSFGESGPYLRIPSVFAEEDFELKNPRIFDIVSENVNIVGPLHSEPEPRSSTSSVLILQERLSSFLDIVETTLVDEISGSGPAFFDALDELRELQSKANGCITRIASLHDELSRFSAEDADARIDTVMILQKLDNIRTIQIGLGTLCELANTYGVARQSAGNEKAHDSIKAMTEFERLAEFRPMSQGLPVVRKMKSDLDNIKLTMGQADIAAFKNVLLQDLIHEVERCDLGGLYRTLVQYHVERKSQPQTEWQLRMNGVDDLRSSLDRILNSLIYADQVQTAYTDYMDAVVKEAKAITKRSLPIADDDDVQSVGNGRNSWTTAEKSNNLAKALRGLTASEFNAMLTEIYLKTCTFVRRVTVQEKLLIDLISFSAQNLSEKSQNLVYSTHVASTTVEVCQARIVKLLGVRLTANSDFNATELHAFYELNMIFNSECEALTGQFGTQLQSVVLNQLRISYRRFDNEHIQSLIAVNEFDTWQPANLHERVQITIDTIVSAAEKDSPTWSASMTAYQGTSDELLGALKAVVVNHKKYMIPVSAAALLSTVEQFLNMAQLLPPLRIDCQSSTIELLQLYNTRSRQLILGAGATKGAGLERITAKHLAIMSQALTVVAGIVPNIEAYFRRHCAGNPALIEFEKIVQLYVQHRVEIHQKLVSIMEDRTVQICKQLSEYLQSYAMNEPREPSDCIAALVKVSIYLYRSRMLLKYQDTLVLARVLTKFLEQEALSNVIHSVVTLEISCLRAEYERAPKTENVRAQIDIDRLHYCDKVSSIVDMQIRELFEP